MQKLDRKYKNEHRAVSCAELSYFATVSQSVSLGIETHDQILAVIIDVYEMVSSGALPDRWTGLSHNSHSPIPFR
jgi:hypothetical protein